MRKEIAICLICWVGIHALGLGSNLAAEGKSKQDNLLVDGRPNIIFVIDHLAKTISLRTYIFPAHPTPEHEQALQSISSFWQRQSAKFSYEFGPRQKKIAYKVLFDVRIVEGSFNENGFFMPHRPISARYLNQVEVISPEKMPKLKGVHSSEVRVVGYAPSNFIYLASSHLDQPLIGAHEMGHQMGLEHSSYGVMAPYTEALDEDLSKFSLKDLFKSEPFVMQFQEELKQLDYHLYLNFVKGKKRIVRSRR